MRNKKQKTFKDVMIDSFGLRNKMDKWKLARAWHDRNVDNGEIAVESLEVEFIVFQQNIFIEETKDIISKLKRIGFEPLSGFPDEELFESFASIYYNKKHNVSFSLYKSENKQAIKTANHILVESKTDGEVALSVFLASVKVLMGAK